MLVDFVGLLVLLLYYDPVAAGSRVIHGLDNLVQALAMTVREFDFQSQMILIGGEPIN